MKPYLSAFTQYSQSDQTVSKCMGLIILTDKNCGPLFKNDV